MQLNDNNKLTVAVYLSGCCNRTGPRCQWIGSLRSISSCWVCVSAWQHVHLCSRGQIPMCHGWLYTAHVSSGFIHTLLSFAPFLLSHTPGNIWMFSSLKSHSFVGFRSLKLHSSTFCLTLSPLCSTHILHSLHQWGPLPFAFALTSLLIIWH